LPGWHSQLTAKKIVDFILNDIKNTELKNIFEIT